jgi:hypothetical protein
MLLLMVAAGLLTAVAVAQQPTKRAAVPARDASGGGSSAYEVGGIAVDVTAKNVDEARRIAWGQAQRRAWPQLWSRLSGRPEADAPRLSDGQIDALVAGIESQGERFSANRYIARLGVVFDRSRTAQRLGGSLSQLQSPPMLLLPLMIDGGAGTLYQSRTAWRDAWVRHRANVTPIDYVLATGSAADNLWLNNFQARRSDRAGWRTIMTRFDTVDVLLAEAQLTRRFPGGPIRALFIARHGPDGEELGRFALSVRSEDALTQLMEDGVRRIDMLYGDALRAGRLRVDDDLAVDLAPLIRDVPLIGEAPPIAGALTVAVITPDTVSLGAAERVLRSLSDDVVVRQLAVGGTSRIDIGLPGGEAALRAALAPLGWALETVAGELVLRRAAPVVAPPAPNAPAVAKPAPPRPVTP